MIERRFSSVWQQLQGKKPHMPHFLNEVYLDGIRGIAGLRIIFDYPVSVIAGGNATGKSTVLFASACAYKPPDAGPRDYVPSTLFPDFRPKQGRRHDHRDKVLLRFEYSTLDGRQSMQWKRGKGWNRSFLGRKHAKQPERPQDALYGRASDTLNVLCEDEAAEAILQGVFDHILPRTQTRSGSVRIGRDTGANEFPTHAAAFRKFGQIGNFVFVLDGDAEGRGIRRKIREKADADVSVLYLPGREAPEAWAWETLPARAEEVSAALGTDIGEFRQAVAQAESVYASASDTPSEIAKGKLYELAQRFGRDATDICRLIGRLEAADDESGIQPLVEQLQMVLHAWRST